MNKKDEALLKDVYGLHGILDRLDRIEHVLSIENIYIVPNDRIVVINGKEYIESRSIEWNIEPE